LNFWLYYSVLGRCRFLSTFIFGRALWIKRAKL